MLVLPRAFIGGASGGVLPTFVAAGTGAAMSGTAGLPSGWAAGDLHIYACMAFDSANSSAANVATPSGYTLLTRAICSDTGPHAGQLAVFYRFAVGGDAGVLVGNGGGTYSTSEGVVIGYRGVNTSTPFEATAATADANSGNNTAYNNITTLGANRMALEFFGTYDVFNGSMTGAPAATWTERADVSSSGACVQIDSKDMAAAGAVGTGTHTVSGGGSVHTGLIATALIPA